MDLHEFWRPKAQRQRFVVDYLALCLVTTSFCLLDWLIMSLPLEAVGLRSQTWLWVLSSVVSLYGVGFCTWSFTQMSMAYAQQAEYRFGLWRSGWGHGWKMSWLQLVKYAFVLPWALLLVVPGLRKLLSYELSEFVLVEHPDWSARKCLAESTRLMIGNRRHFVRFYVARGVIHVVATMLPIVCKLVEFLLAPLHIVEYAHSYFAFKRSV